MNKIKSFFFQSLQDYAHPYLLALAILMVLMGLTYWFMPVYFETNDAGRMMFQMAGYYTGEVENVTNFIGLPLCTMIVALYKMVPSLPWFSLVLCLFFVTACLVSGASMTRILKKHDHRVITGMLMMVAIYGICFIYPITHMHIYYTCALMGLSIAIMVVAIDIEKDTWLHYILYAIIALAHLFVCFNLGFSASVCVIGFVGIAVLYQCLKWLEISWKKMFIFGFIAAMIAGIGLGTYLISTDMKGETMSEYQAYNKYRLSFTDYPHVSYDEDPQRYEEAGWSKSFYRLADTNHYLIDEKFNVESLSKIVDKHGKVNLNFEDVNIRSALGDGFYTLFDSPTSTLLVFTMILLFMVSVFAQIRHQWWKDQAIWMSYLCCVAAVVLIVYLSLNGRFMLRAALSVLFPAVVTQMALVYKSNVGKQLNFFGKHTYAIACFIPCLLGSVSGYQGTIQYKSLSNLQEAESINRRFEAYAIEHPENLYIFGIDFVSVREPFHTFEKGQLKNTFNYGTSYTYTPMFYKQLGLNGRSELNSKTLLEDGVYFVSDAPKNRYTFNLIDYFMEEYNVIGLEVVEEVDDLFYVLKPYVLPLPSADYSGVVEALGKKYYVENGKIKIGSFNGVETTLSEKVNDISYEGKYYFISCRGWVKDASQPNS